MARRLEACRVGKHVDKASDRQGTSFRIIGRFYLAIRPEGKKGNRVAEVRVEDRKAE